ALDRGDRAAVILHREREAGEDALAIDEDGAGAAGTLVASLLGARQMQRFAQQIEQRHPRIGRHRYRCPIDHERHRNLRLAVGMLIILPNWRFVQGRNASSRRWPHR
nr:hypothetical protein [Tanacetum cinerariifolium]